MSTVQIIHDGTQAYISGDITLRFYCFNAITTLTNLQVWINDIRNPDWNPEYDIPPDFRWVHAYTENFASNQPTEDYRNSEYVEIDGDGFKNVNIPSLTAYPGQIICVQVQCDNQTEMSATSSLPESDKFAPGIVFSDVNNIAWTGEATRMKATFDIQEMLDEDILDFEPWDGYPVDEHNRPYQKGAWRITNANDGFPYVALPTETKIWTLNEYLRENNQNIPLQRFLKETVNGQTVYTPLHPHYKEIIG